MSKSDSVYRIAFYGQALSPSAQHIAAGVARYQLEHDGYLLRDFLYHAESSEADYWANLHAPYPWREWRPDGLIVQLGFDNFMCQWLEASGLPMVSTNGEWIG